jgi:multicopper oxidase
MMLAERLWIAFINVINFLTLSTVSREDNLGVQQIPLSHKDLLDAPGPIFAPPGRLRDDGSNFTCDYSAMTGWVECSAIGDRTCWLHNPATGVNLSVMTDYEQIANTPVGILRQYNLTVGLGPTVNVDGEDFDAAMLFNGAFPGPWIQACWGDTVEITVNVEQNFKMGSSIHWHGIRQWKTMHMDGVPGITQCPIAPGSQFVYRWRAMQYGSSWYHSHYSLQYADGLLGPLVSLSKEHV